MTPGKLHRLAFVRRLCVDFRYPNSVILPLFISISRLDHFNLAAYGLPSCCPTLNHKRLPPWVQRLATRWLARPSGAGFAPAKTRDLARPHWDNIRMKRAFGFIQHFSDHFSKITFCNRLYEKTFHAYGPGVIFIVFSLYPAQRRIGTSGLMETEFVYA
jgi:hypothetical protein